MSGDSDKAKQKLKNEKKLAIIMIFYIGNILINCFK